MTVTVIALDSFDTAFAGCTTHLASIIAYRLLRAGYTLADYPWLVRLNPAIPWKTRGNGAVAILIHTDSRADAEKAARIARGTAEKYAEGLGGASKASLVAFHTDAETAGEYVETRPPCLTRLYWRAVSEAVHPRLASACLSRLEVLTVLGPSNRGLVGALAAAGADFSWDYTFELLVYRHPSNWLKQRRIDPDSVVEFDMRTRPLTFSNYDYEKDKPLIAPSTLDPVLYGVRGEKEDPLLEALDIIEAGEEPSHWMLYLTNQATNMHLKPKPVAYVKPYDNPVLTGFVSTKPRRIPGGHVVATIRDHTGEISIAAYRETGSLRSLLEAAEPGDTITVAGQAKPHRGRLTVNIELLTVNPQRDRPPLRSCSWRWFYPPLSSLHHLSTPPERCLYRGEKPPPHRGVKTEALQWFTRT